MCILCIAQLSPREHCTIKTILPSRINHHNISEISVSEREDDHDDDVLPIVGKHDGQVFARLSVAQHQHGHAEDTKDTGTSDYPLVVWL